MSNATQHSVFLASLFSVILAGGSAPTAAAESGSGRQPPNIVWIVVEDASPHIGCYGETTIATPHIDALADEGVRFSNAIVTSPVCSTSRSAMVTGMYPTTLGAHNHRSQCIDGKGGGNVDYFDSFRLPIASVPELFREAGYYVTNSGLNKSAKTDYNFVADDLYHSGDWSNRQAGQPFFAQIQLAGGKARGAKVPDPVDPDEVTLPPYYPDDPVIRRDWATYLNSWIKADDEVGQIVQRLRDEGLLDETVVFFWTDHGVSHVRGKQFLYEEGIRVPLIVRFGDLRDAGTVREDLVQQIDVAAASLALAGIAIPDYLQGRDILAADHQPRRYAFAARDRCDETVDIIRAVRTDRFKYIRNFLSPIPHAQPNQYKDGKRIVQRMRQMNGDGQLNPLQARVFAAPRPVEELYDLQADPWEAVNLAEDPRFQQTLVELRTALREWMVRTRDVGLIPEPILEDLGRKYGNKYHVLQQPEHGRRIDQILQVIQAGERGDAQALRRSLHSADASARYWAATWLGTLGVRSAARPLMEATRDPTPAVRIAAAQALCQIGHHPQYLPLLASHIESANLIAGMYAIRALEQINRPLTAVLPAIRQARDNRYEFTRRIARRLIAQQPTEPVPPWSPDEASIERFRQSKPGVNFLEADVPSFTWPAVLTMQDGRRITSVRQWEQRRRPELIELFEQHVYGRLPPGGEVSGKIVDQRNDALDGTAVFRKIRVTVQLDQRTLSFPLYVYTPADAVGPVPGFLLINHRERELLLPDREANDGFFPAAEIVARGFAALAFVEDDLSPDSEAAFDSGLATLAPIDQPRAKDAWGGLAAWGWGASRVLDVLEADDRVDARRVAIVGHSRGGKAALWAAARDQRFAIVFSNQSGCGGAALSRRRFGNPIDVMTQRHTWCAPRFAEYAGREDDLPVDQHQLLALIAPRPLYVNSAAEDLWADPVGEYQSLAHASPAYQLYGHQGVELQAGPRLGETVRSGPQAHHLRPGPHDLTGADWLRYLDFAASHWK